ncbi:hypothetical protein BDQ17DRAFT_1328299 [Cyathus striatus]|nr:hypothetical protein BDQ17DRAFT_1328299 [Cyathus striatus]
MSGRAGMMKHTGNCERIRGEAKAWEMLSGKRTAVNSTIIMEAWEIMSGGGDSMSRDQNDSGSVGNMSGGMGNSEQEGGKQHKLLYNYCKMCKNSAITSAIKSLITPLASDALMVIVSHFFHHHAQHFWILPVIYFLQYELFTLFHRGMGNNEQGGATVSSKVEFQLSSS